MMAWIAGGIIIAAVIVWFVLDYRKNKDEPPSGWLF
jgi:hypothetical protein